MQFYRNKQSKNTTTITKRLTIQQNAWHIVVNKYKITCIMFLLNNNKWLTILNLYK